jgi:ADP-ribose pyrophosphatase YjhB (NUDIX family)
MDDVSYYTNDKGKEVKQSNSYKVLLVVVGKLLLIHNELTPEKLTMPGGRAHIGETLQQTLEREFLEETGVKCQLKVGKLIHAQRHVFRSPVADRWNDMTNHYYLCQAVDSAAVAGLSFYPLAEAEQLVSHVHERAAVKALMSRDGIGVGAEDSHKEESSTF